MTVSPAICANCIWLSAGDRCQRVFSKRYAMKVNHHDTCDQWADKQRKSGTTERNHDGRRHLKSD